MAKRTLTTGRVIDGKLYSTGDQPELTAEQEKELDALGILAPKAEAPKAAPKASGTGKAAPKADKE